MRYEKIVDKLIKNNFLTLKKRKPKIFEFTIFRGYAFYLPILNVIGINKKCNKFSDKEKIGLLAHELSHAEQSSKLRLSQNIFLFIYYWFSRKTRKKIEVQADKLAIKKGYAKESLAMTKIYEKEFGIMRYGLSARQIKALMPKKI